MKSLSILADSSLVWSKSTGERHLAISNHRLEILWTIEKQRLAGNRTTGSSDLRRIFRLGVILIILRFWFYLRGFGLHFKRRHDIFFRRLLVILGFLKQCIAALFKVFLFFAAFILLDYIFCSGVIYIHFFRRIFDVHFLLEHFLN